MFRYENLNSDMPVVPIETEEDGLIQRTCIHYTTDRQGKRIRCRAGEGITRTIVMHLPLAFSPSTWVRHRYSFEDMVDIFNYNNSDLLWQLAVMLSVPLTNSSVKLSFARPTSMVFSSKAIVMVRIMNQLRQYYNFSSQSVLDKTHEEHVPPPPVHRITSEEYQHWKMITAACEPLRMLGPNERPELFAWRGILLAPVCMEDNSIYMIRVITEEQSKRTGRTGESLVSQPVVFHTQGKTYHGLVDEACFFLPEFR